MSPSDDKTPDDKAPDDKFTFSYEYRVEAHKVENAYLVPKHIFERIKDRLSENKSIVPVTQNLGSLFLGIAGSALITIVTIANSNTLCLIILGMSLVAGLLFWIFSHIFNKLEKNIKTNFSLI